MAPAKLTLYQFEGCPYCALVRQKLDELQLPFTVVPVPREREQRRAVYEVSGQYLVPTLVVEDEGARTVLTDENEIVDFLQRRFAAGR